MNQMDSYNPSFFNQTSAHQQFGSSPAHAQPQHGPPPPQFAQGIQPPHHPPFSNGAAAAPAGGFPLASSMGMGSAQASAGGVMMQPAAMQQQSPRGEWTRPPLPIRLIRRAACLTRPKPNKLRD